MRRFRPSARPLARPSAPPAALSAASLLPALLLALAVPGPSAAQPSGRAAPQAQSGGQPGAQSGAQTGAQAAAPDANRIVAVVNGDVVTESELRSRARLFAISAGIQPSGDLLARIRPQILRQVIEERLRLQEIARRRIPVGDDDVAEAIGDLERRNNLPPGGLRAQLRGAGVEARVLYDQIRSQIGWSRLIRGQLGDNGGISDEAVRETIAAQSARTGQPEYLVSEIFIPVEDPSKSSETRRFVDDVIARLRQGLPFPVAATQFSQSQTALQGGDLGWVRTDQMDPDAASVVQRMPPGAISNPIDVPGGFQIIALRQKRETGRDQATVVSVRQAFLPFQGTLNPQAPTEQQRATLARAQAIRGGCGEVEAANRAANSPRPADPGELRQETLQPPQLRQLVSGLPVGRASQPIVTPEGILVIAVCSRETRNAGAMSQEQARAQLLRERVETLSRQQLRDLRRRAVIEMRS